jgi:hypothetical protein
LPTRPPCAEFGSQNQQYPTSDKFHLVAITCKQLSK